MIDIRRKWLWGIVAVLVAAALVYAAYLLWLAPKDPYAGLSTRWDVSLDDATRTLLEQRIATTQAAIALAEQSGSEVETDLYLSLAQDAYAIGDLVTSREALVIALNDNTLNVAVWNTYGNVLEKMNDLALAEHAYQRAIELGAPSEYYMDYVDFLREHYPERDEEAKTVLEYMITSFGRTQGIMVALAEWYYDHGDCDRAIDHLKVAQTLSQNNEGIAAKLAAYRASCSEE